MISFQGDLSLVQHSWTMIVFEFSPLLSDFLETTQNTEHHYRDTKWAA